MQNISFTVNSVQKIRARGRSYFKALSMKAACEQLRKSLTNCNAHETCENRAKDDNAEDNQKVLPSSIEQWKISTDCRRKTQ